MGFVGDTLTSIIGGSNPAEHANITPGATAEQAASAYANTQRALTEQNAFMQALQAQNGVQNQSDIYNQFGQVAAGQGPNPAQAQLANATAGNVANQAALAAGQRGASQNVGMIARQAGQQGAATQQQAVGQGAALQAQQSLAAMQAQGQMAGQQIAQQQAAQSAYNQSALQQQSNIIGGITGTNSASVADQGSVNQGAAAIKGASIGAISGAGAALAGGGGGGGAAHGGMITPSGPQSSLAKAMKMAKGGKVPVMLSPGEAYIPPGKVQAVANGESPKSAGRMIPGTAKVAGDSPKNDIVPSALDSGGVVIPRTKMKDDEAASKFVQAILAKESMKKGKR